VQQQEMAPEHVIRCHMSELPETIAADASAIEQIFTNLLSNAVKYSLSSPLIMGHLFVEFLALAASSRVPGVAGCDCTA